MLPRQGTQSLRDTEIGPMTQAREIKGNPVSFPGNVVNEVTFPWGLSFWHSSLPL